MHRVRDVKINVVSFPPIIHPPPPPSFPLHHLEIAFLASATRNVKRLTRGSTSCLPERFLLTKANVKAFRKWTQRGNRSLVFISDTELGSCVFIIFPPQYRLSDATKAKTTLWNIYCLFGCAVLQNWARAGNKRSPDTHEACVLCTAALACPALCAFIPPTSLLWGPLETKNTSPEHKLWMLWVCSALLSVGLPYTSSLLFFFFFLPWFGWYFTSTAPPHHHLPPPFSPPLSPTFCDVIFVKQVFQSQERESENGRLCLSGWFPLIPWLSCPLLWSQCIVVHAQILHRKVTFVWLARSPPQRD